MINLTEQNKNLEDKITRMKQNVIQLKEKFDLDIKRRKLDASNIDNNTIIEEKDKNIDEMVENKVELTI